MEPTRINGEGSQSARIIPERWYIGLRHRALDWEERLGRENRQASVGTPPKRPLAVQSSPETSRPPACTAEASHPPARDREVLCPGQHFQVPALQTQSYTETLLHIQSSREATRTDRGREGETGHSSDHRVALHHHFLSIFSFFLQKLENTVRATHSSHHSRVFTCFNRALPV